MNRNLLLVADKWHVPGRGIEEWHTVLTGLCANHHLDSPYHHLDSPYHHLDSPYHHLDSPNHHLDSPYYHLDSL